jgi:hypothetical protein
VSDSSFTSAKESTVQLLTVASAVLTLTITFFEKISIVPSGTDKLVLSIAWIFLFLSVFFGLWTLLALTGTLSLIERHERNAEFGFVDSDIVNAHSLLQKLRTIQENPSVYIWSRFSVNGKQALAKCADCDPLCEEGKSILLIELNNLIWSGAVLDLAAFAHIALTREVRNLAASDLKGARIAYANRRLLEDAYPMELKTEPSPSIFDSNVSLPSFAQVVAFLLGLIFTVWFGISTLAKFHKVEAPKTKVESPG